MSELDLIVEKLAATSVNDFETYTNSVVNFANKGLKLDSEEDAAELVECIKNCVHMTTLCLEGNTIGVPAAKCIGEALKLKSKFKKALWKDMFTQRTENEIPNALYSLSTGIRVANAQLVVLDLSDNAFGPRGLKGIIELLSSSSCFTLEELYLNNNGLGISGARMLASALFDCLTNSINANLVLNLKVFQCGRNRIENEGCIALCETLKHIRSLEHLSMPQNGIYHKGINSLAENLVENINLVSINLGDNTFTRRGAEGIAKILPTLKNIEILNFSDCLVNSDGAEILANALQESCPKLKELNLGYNEINFNSGLKIIKAIIQKENLKELILNGNQFGEKGCILIKKFIEDNKKLHIFGSLSDDEGSDDEVDIENEDKSNDEGSGDEDDIENENKSDDEKNCESNMKNENLANTESLDKINQNELENNMKSETIFKECETKTANCDSETNLVMESKIIEEIPHCIEKNNNENSSIITNTACNIEQNEPTKERNEGDLVEKIDLKSNNNLFEKNKENILDSIYVSNFYEDFIKSPSTDKLLKLYELNIENVVPFSDFTTLECFEFFIKISSIIDNDNDKAIEAAYHFLDIVLAHAFSSVPEVERWKVNSDFSICLGLVKCDEDEVQPVLQKYRGIFILLNHAVKQCYFPDSTRELLKFLMPKTLKSEPNTEAKMLLKYLNQAV